MASNSEQNGSDPQSDAENPDVDEAAPLEQPADIGQKTPYEPWKISDKPASVVEALTNNLPYAVAQSGSLPDSWKRRQRKCIFLFLATCLSTFMIGGNIFPAVLFQEGRDYLMSPQLTEAEMESDRRVEAEAIKEAAEADFPVTELIRDAKYANRMTKLTPEEAEERGTNLAAMSWRGLAYAVPLMTILMFHEMGHYLQARRYGVPATLPFFIPMPIPPLGTMGAVIVQQAGVADRKSLFDIAVSGPLAGLVVALPVLYYGVATSGYMAFDLSQGGVEFGEPLILQWLIEYVHGVAPEGQTMALNSMMFAGWVGILITALNLIPAGQLDGGHILYTLIGRKAHFVAYAVLAGGFAYMAYIQYPAYLLLFILILWMGPKHPPSADDTVPLGWPRIIIGWLTLAFIIVGFTIRPIVVHEPEAAAEPPAAPAAVEQTAQL